MTLNNAFAPHLRLTERSSSMSLDLLIAILPLCILSTVYYGIRPVILVLIGLVSAVLCETVCCLLLRRRPSVLDGTAAVYGALCGALMSPLSPYWLPATAAAFAILVVKMPFGGTGRTVFHPTAAGVALVTLCFPTLLFTYPDPGINASLSLGDVSSVITTKSPAAQLATGGSTAYTWDSLLLGNFPGPIGCTAILVLIACALYLFTRRTASPLITLPYLLVCALCALLFPRVTGGSFANILLELCSGSLLFCGVFLLTDSVTAPRYWLGRILYGVLAGVLVMALRHFGRFECGECFAVLIMNAFAPIIDRWSWHLVHFLRHRFKERNGGATNA